MKKLNIADRLFFLATVFLAGYQIVRGVEDFDFWVTLFLTVAFGVLLLAGLLLFLFGFEILEKKLVVVVATLAPLSLSAALIFAFLPRYRTLYALFAGLGFLGIAITQFKASGKTPVLFLAPIHAVAGLIIFLLPLIRSFGGQAPMSFALVGAGGALMGLGGLLLAFLKSGAPILSKETIFSVFPLLLALTTALFVLGF
jgi:hypothetical protein